MTDTDGDTAAVCSKAGDQHTGGTDNMLKDSKQNERQYESVCSRKQNRELNLAGRNQKHRDGSQMTNLIRF